jgi:hypothetical protein
LRSAARPVSAWRPLRVGTRRKAVNPVWVVQRRSPLACARVDIDLPPRPQKKMRSAPGEGWEYSRVLPKAAAGRPGVMFGWQRIVLNSRRRGRRPGFRKPVGSPAK